MTLFRKAFSAALAILLASIVSPAAFAAKGGTAPVARDGEIERVIRQRLDAYAKGDASRWASFVADDCLCKPGSKSEVENAIENRPSSTKDWYSDIIDLQVRVHDEVAVAQYRITEYTKFGDHDVANTLWRTEIHRKGARGWVLIGLADSPIPADPPAAKVDPVIFDAYVGRYQYTPDVIMTITREGAHLMAQATGQAKEELFPQDNVTYFGKGQDWRMIFLKDKKNQVTSLVVRQNGQDLVGKRIP
jgi:ketosteroid isomerase-like protein